MLKYQLAAAALKAFSINGLTKQAYRKMGNLVGGRTRSKGIKPGYVERADGNLRYIEQHGAIADGQRLLELGTGWVHWESVFTRLFYEVEIVLFDVWDNRQFEAFQFYTQTLGETLATATKRDPAAIAKAQGIIAQILACHSFEEVYALLGFTYVIDASGSLGAIADDSIDLVISSDVMEHIPAAALPGLATDLRRVLKNGGHAAQQIVPADHLTIYDRAVHGKNYLRYTDSQWQLRFENDVQYCNRWQQSDFVKLFAKHGFAIISDEIIETADTTVFAIAPRWKDYSRADLDATVTRLLVKNNKG